MGTRGTLHVYLNGELKIRQYNQWDSYPTGQFRKICDFMKRNENIAVLVKKLSQTRFFTKEEIEQARDFESKGGFDCGNTQEFNRTEEFYKISSILFLINRDYGADFLYQVVCMCRNLDFTEYPKYSYAIPDWAMLTDDEEQGLAGEEGNYRIDIRTENVNKNRTNIHFKLSGDWHGNEREFPEDYIPKIKEIEEWEKNDNGE